MKEQFSNQCNIVNHMKHSVRGKFLLCFLKKGCGTDIWKKKRGTEKNISSER